MSLMSHSAAKFGDCSINEHYMALLRGELPGNTVASHEEKWTRPCWLAAGVDMSGDARELSLMLGRSQVDYLLQAIPT